MDKSSFRALAALLVGIPLLGATAFVIHPAGRAFLVALASPPPTRAARATADADASAPTLAPAARVLGAESVELRTLREDTPAGTGLTGDLRAPRAALYELTADGTLAPTPGASTRPRSLRRPALPFRDDPAVDGTIHQLTTNERVRPRLLAALQRNARFAHGIGRILDAWKLPESVVAVAFVESAFSPAAKADQGEHHDASTDARADRVAGLWGLTPDVSHVYGLSMLPAYDERRGIVTGTEAAAHYLADLHERFGSWELAFVAFGFGYRATLEELAKHDNDGFWELAPRLPPAITSYVVQILGVAFVHTNLDALGLDSALRTPAVSTSELEVPAGTTLASVARASGISSALVRELNPEYTTDVVPTTDFAMVVHVPSETLVRARESLPRLLGTADEPEPDAGGAVEPATAERSPTAISRGSDSRLFYRVKDGDTLAALARQYEVSEATLASDNALDPTGSLKAGMILAIRLPAEPPAPIPSAPPKKRKTTQHGR